MSLRPLIGSIEFVCVGLALVLVYIFFSMYKQRRLTFLLGIPFGFLFLLISHFFLGIHMINLTFYDISAFSSTIMWVRVVTQTVGFSLIALSYFVASWYQGTSKLSYLIILVGTFLLVLSVFGVLLLLANPLDLAAIYGSNKIFTIVNLVLLSMVTVFLFRKMKFKNGKTPILLSALLGFFCFWLGQFIFLVYSMVINDTAVLIGSQVARIVGFALFIQIYYSAQKEASLYACGKAE